MNIKEYIESGILESYAMGLTTADQSRDVERMAAAYPEVKAELEEIQLAMENYALAYEKQPPAGVKEQVMQAIASEGKNAKVIDIRAVENTGSRSRFGTYAAAAAIVLLIVSGVLNYMLYNRLNETEEQMNAMQATNLRNAVIIEEQMEKMKNELAVMRDPRNKIIRLNGVDNYPSSLVTIYWNTASKEVYADVNMLPAPPKGMQYQLWAIVDGKPVDAGMIDMSDRSIHKMKNFGSAQAFAVTLEKEGGSPVPNLSAMYVIGNV